MDNTIYVCPFWQRDIKSNLYCEGARLDFKNGATLRDYARRYCADIHGWRCCSIAAALNEQYEKEC
ncbi:MAG: hypothetical protein IJP23_03835 [Oscillospiraceae bacterium]|nr:hypothetical protein [Oscillospiraceae bacterium]